MSFYINGIELTPGDTISYGAEEITVREDGSLRKPVVVKSPRKIYVSKELFNDLKKHCTD